MATLQTSFDITLESDAFDTSPLRVFALEGREAISELFRFDVDLACIGDRAATDNLAPGEPLTLAFWRDGAVVRRVHGVIDSVRQRLDEGDGRQSFRVRVVPRAARLGLVATQSIFLERTVPQIIGSKLEAVGLGGDDVAFHLLASYPTLELVVQFAETDYALVSRRAEHVGISFFFVAEDGIDRLRFVDHAGGFPVLADAPTARIGVLTNEVERIDRLEREQVSIPGLYGIEDYNYRRPLVAPTGQASLEGGAGGIIEYGSHTKTPEDAAALATIRAEEILCRRNVYRGEGTLVVFTAGHRVTVEEHGDLPAVELLLTAVEHRATIPLRSEGGASEGAPRASYRNHFEAVDTQHTFRPRRVTPRPRMPSFVTGVVQVGVGGAAGGAAVLDSDGRYTVQVHFETAIGETRPKASHPMRMMQPFGGTGHGMHFPLRPGTEVVIGFANGDPDRPLIVGAVPNALTLSPVTGADPTRNRITTRMGVAFEIGEKE